MSPVLACSHIRVRTRRSCSRLHVPWRSVVGTGNYANNAARCVRSPPLRTTFGLRTSMEATVPSISPRSPPAFATPRPTPCLARTPATR
ncbi:hypothetical protein FS749_015760 [Ceratobasidium sp. UAMH 11750]|nr:hypothetical protein FS749_015760 [Ceratobasidium sp. UAMH 11750]